MLPLQLVLTWRMSQVPTLLHLVNNSQFFCCLRLSLPFGFQGPTKRPICELGEHGTPVVRVAQSRQRSRRQRQPHEGAWRQLALVSEVVDAEGSGCAPATQAASQQGLQLCQGMLMCLLDFCPCCGCLGNHRPSCCCCRWPARHSCQCGCFAAAPLQGAGMVWSLCCRITHAVLHMQQQQRGGPIVRTVDDGLRCLSMASWPLCCRPLPSFIQRPCLLF
jgi:hypothetical protein